MVRQAEPRDRAGMFIFAVFHDFCSRTGLLASEYDQYSDAYVRYSCNDKQNLNHNRLILRPSI
jgi:hypothetical protein